MPKQTKANKATKEARINKVYECLITGMSRYRIWQYVTTDEKAKILFEGISMRQLDRYIAEANGLFTAASEYVRTNEFGKAKGRLETVIEKGFKLQDYPRVISAIKELNLLMGLHTPIKHELKLTADNEIMLARLLSEMERQGYTASDVFNELLAEMVDKNADE